ncbi:hypothetical protein [Segetibacter koreensis]|uniref:hypothetical protein n=1 Tax=Segetibacter koreensis TaxID=398037 RepID=UPI00037FA927|nr:hypothetical protein [Segetibacter koreensis]
MPLDNNTPNVRNNPQPRPEVAAEKETVIAAHDQAEKDMEEDDELNTKPAPEDDLDEGEIARFEDGDEGPAK